MINIPRTLSIAGVQFCRRAVWGKKMRAPLLGLPKSTYQKDRNLYSVFEGCSLFIFLKHGRKRSTSRGLKHHTYGLAARSSTTVRQRAEQGKNLAPREKSNFRPQASKVQTKSTLYLPRGIEPLTIGFFSYHLSFRIPLNQ